MVTLFWVSSVGLWSTKVQLWMLNPVCVRGFKGTSIWRSDKTRHTSNDADLPFVLTWVVNKVGYQKFRRLGITDLFFPPDFILESFIFGGTESLEGEPRVWAICAQILRRNGLLNFKNDGFSPFSFGWKDFYPVLKGGSLMKQMGAENGKLGVDGNCFGGLAVFEKAMDRVSLTPEKGVITYLDVNYPMVDLMSNRIYPSLEVYANRGTLGNVVGRDFLYIISKNETEYGYWCFLVYDVAETSQVFDDLPHSIGGAAEKSFLEGLSNHTVGELVSYSFGIAERVIKNDLNRCSVFEVFVTYLRKHRWDEMATVVCCADSAHSGLTIEIVAALERRSGVPPDVKEVVVRLNFDGQEMLSEIYECSGFEVFVNYLIKHRCDEMATVVYCADSAHSGLTIVIVAALERRSGVPPDVKEVVVRLNFDGQEMLSEIYENCCCVDEVFQLKILLLFSDGVKERCVAGIWMVWPQTQPCAASCIDLSKNERDERGRWEMKVILDESLLGAVIVKELGRQEKRGFDVKDLGSRPSCKWQCLIHGGMACVLAISLLLCCGNVDFGSPCELGFNLLLLSQCGDNIVSMSNQGLIGKLEVVYHVRDNMVNALIIARRNASLGGNTTRDGMPCWHIYFYV